MEKRILIIGLVFFLMFSAIIPVGYGYNITITNDKEQLNTKPINPSYVGSIRPSYYFEPFGWSSSNHENY